MTATAPQISDQTHTTTHSPPIDLAPVDHLAPLHHSDATNKQSEDRALPLREEPAAIISDGGTTINDDAGSFPIFNFRFCALISGSTAAMVIFNFRFSFLP